MSWLPELLEPQSCQVQLVQSDNRKRLEIFLLITLHWWWWCWCNSTESNTQPIRKALTSECWLSLSGIMLTHCPAPFRLGRSLWTPDPVGISLESTARFPRSAVPLDTRMQSFLSPGLYKLLKQTANLFWSKAICSWRGDTDKDIFKCFSFCSSAAAFCLPALLDV